MDKPRILVLKELDENENEITPVEQQSLLNDYVAARKVLVKLRQGSSDQEIEDEIQEIVESLKSIPKNTSMSDLLK